MMIQQNRALYTVGHAHQWREMGLNLVVMYTSNVVYVEPFHKPNQNVSPMQIAVHLQVPCVVLPLKLEMLGHPTSQFLVLHVVACPWTPYA